MGMPKDNPYNATGGGNWGWLVPKEIDALVIAEEDPAHPEHAIHAWRTSLDNPEYAEFVAAIDVMGMEGLKEAKAIIVYLDGKTPTVADGRCTVTAIRRDINPKRKAADRLSVKMTSTRDPDLARDLNNSHRQKDPPLVRARRYEAAHAVDGDKRKAAARNDFTLADAEKFAKCLALPADLQMRINRLELPPDVALRLGKSGGAEAVKAVAAITTPAGKVDPVKARKAADAAPRRPRAMSAKFVATFAKEAALVASVSKQAAAAIAFVGGDRNALDDFPALRKAAESAGYDFEANRARTVKDDGEGDAE